MPKRLAKAAWGYLQSPSAKRLEIALALGLYEAIRVALGHA